MGDTFKGKFEQIKPGDRIGLICGPGEFPQEGMCRTGSVHKKGENRWGRFLAVQMDDSSELEYVHGLTERGIGAYLIEGGKRRRGATKFSRRAERKAITALLGALTGEKPSGEQVASVAETLER